MNPQTCKVLFEIQGASSLLPSWAFQLLNPSYKTIVYQSNQFTTKIRSNKTSGKEGSLGQIFNGHFSYLAQR